MPPLIATAPLKATPMLNGAFALSLLPMPPVNVMAAAALLQA